MDLIVDTNVLINGLFEPRSFSRAVLQKALKGELRLHIGRDTFDEALRILDRAGHVLGIDLVPGFRQSLVALSPVELERVEDDQLSDFTEVKGKEDQRLAVLANRYGFRICTNDIDDFVRAAAKGIQTITPEDASSGGSIGLPKIMKGFLSSPERGSAYFHFTDPAGRLDKGLPVAGKFVFLTQIGQLTFDAESYQLQLSHLDGFTLVTKPPKTRPSDGGVHAIVSYDHDLQICLQLGYRGPRTCKTHRWVPAPPEDGGRFSPFVSELPILIRLAVFLPQPLSESGCNNLITGRAVSAPYERRQLEEIIRDYYI